MTGQLWQQAWQWLQIRRRNAPHNADVWHLRHHARRLQPRIQQQVQDGTYRLSPMQTVRRTAAGRDSDRAVMWSAADALVLKWAALTLAPGLPVHERCLHLEGGPHRAVRCVAGQLKRDVWQFVYRTDIRGYYRHIRKDMAWRIWQGITGNTACLLHTRWRYYDQELKK